VILLHLILWITLLCTYVLVKGGLSCIARGRLYKSGTIWCVWRWTDVESEYILRLHVVKTPWFAICLHWIRKPDKEPWLHDHPVSFLSVVLRGRYAELRSTEHGDPEIRVHSWFNFIRARKTDCHRIIFTRKRTLTLCFMGPKTREWGFHMPEGWVFWKDYYARLKAGENMRREDRLAAFQAQLPLDALTRRFHQTYGDPSFSYGRRVEDVDTRELDTAEPADFDAEAETWPGDHR
jgi:hypothetical protein